MTAASRPSSPPSTNRTTMRCDTLAPYHISSSFIDDAFSRRCQEHQNRPFLSVGVEPAVGQRVEVMMFLKIRGEDNDDGEEGRGAEGNDRDWSEANMVERKIRPFRLSGEVVEVRPLPSLESPQSEPSSAPSNRAVTRSQSRRVTLDPEETPTSPPANALNNSQVNKNLQFLRPSTSPEDCGPGQGSLFLADIVRVFANNGEVVEYMQDPTPEMLEEWDGMDMEAKERILTFMLGRWGAVHGQEVVCEARLNFDYDIRRGNENGPWADLIPVDGRDIWRFTLAYNDQYDDEAWRAVPSSFVNLGRESRNRCWPWTSDEVLPYRRTGADAPVWGNGPGGALQVHVDLGPFLERNVGRRRPNTMQAFAA